MPDSGAVDAALVAKLLADAPLRTLAPDGIYIDEAVEGVTRFVIVSLIDEHDEPMFNGRAFEDALYLVKYVERSTSSVNARAAAARIDALLDPNGAGGTLTVTGYSLMTVKRDARLTPQVEVDGVDASIRWQHRGGRYRVMVSPN